MPNAVCLVLHARSACCRKGPLPGFSKGGGTIDFSLKLAPVDRPAMTVKARRSMLRGVGLSRRHHHANHDSEYLHEAQRL